MEVLESYAKGIIHPIEDEIKKLKGCYYSKNIFKYPFKGLYKYWIEKYEKLLFEKLNDYEGLIDEEFKFQKEFEKKLKLNNK
jgi:hypothetical protein